MLKQNEIYVIQFDYSTEETDGVDLYLFRNFDTAFAKFKNIINPKENSAPRGNVPQNRKILQNFC